MDDVNLPAKSFDRNMKDLYGDAYGWCERYAKYHRLLAGILFSILACIISVILISIGFFIYDPTRFEKSKDFMYIFYIIAAPIFGVCVGLYKFSIKEVTRNQHFLLGFKRMYIAGSSHTDGFGTEVRKALTTDAFPHFENAPKASKGTKKIAAIKKKLASPHE